MDRPQIAQAPVATRHESGHWEDELGALVCVRVPFTHMSRSLTELDDGSFVQRISGTVRWQSCDDDVCHLPRTERFSIDVPGAVHLRSEHEFKDPNGMDVATHLVKMVSRRTSKPLADILTEMAGTDDSRDA